MLKIGLIHYKRLFIISVFYCVCAISHAQQTTLFDAFTGELNPSQQELINTLESHQTTKRTRVVSIDKSVFGQSEITANLFNDQTLTFYSRDIGTSGVSCRTWTGNSPENLGSVAIIINGNRISAHMTSSEGSFEIFPLDNFGMHVILEHDLSQYGSCGNAENTPRSIDNNESEFEFEFEVKKERPQRTPGSNECRIRLLVAYTPGAQINTMSTYNRTMIEHIELAILQMNQGYANSLADQRVELAYLYKTTDEETGNSTTDINDLRDTSDGKWDEIHDFRNQYNADMVALVTDGSYPDMCGRAYGFDYDLGTDMFQITEYNCAVANFTLAHEYGHLQGCRHNVDSEITPFPFGHGYSQGAIYQTIMAVCCGGVRVNYWSNPYIYYPGTGMMGTLNLNYNTLALNTSDSTVAHHRLTPSTIDSDDNLADDHLVNSNTSGLVIATDTTLSGAYLILQSETKVKLAAGFRAYNGANGNYLISAGCSDAISLISAPTGIVKQRDSQPEHISPNPQDMSAKDRDSSSPSRNQRDR
jgi:peptidyl-Asp metalloendopeptidase